MSDGRRGGVLGMVDRLADFDGDGSGIDDVAGVATGVGNVAGRLFGINGAGGDGIVDRYQRGAAAGNRAGDSLVDGSALRNASNAVSNWWDSL